ncbi:hypothetical protein V8E55_010329 [Tylopilus felleus]
MADLDLVRNMLSSLVLCTEAATQLLGTLNSCNSGTDAPLEVDDSLLAYNVDSEDYDLAGTPDIATPNILGAPPSLSLTSTLTASVTPPAPTPASSPGPPDTPTAPMAQEPTPIPGTPTSILTPIPGLPATVPAVDPTGPHHLWIPGMLTADGCHQRLYNCHLFNIPHKEETGQLYLVTQGRRIGIFTSWAHTSPYVTSVSFATCSKVNFLDEGIMHMMEAIDLKEARWLT